MTVSNILTGVYRKLTGRAYPYNKLKKDLTNFAIKNGYYKVDFRNEKIDVVLLTLNRKDETLRTLHSLYKTTVDFNLIIIDQNSNDGTKEMLVEFCKDKINTNLITLSENIGVSGGRARAIEYCKTDYVTFIDNDMFFVKGYFENLLATLQTENVAAVVGKIILPNEKIELNNPVYNIDNKWIEFFDNDKNKHYSDSSTLQQKECKWIPGVAMWSKDVLIKNPIDKNMIGGFEDNEYSYRIGLSGLKFINSPKSLVIHIRAEFTKALNDSTYTTGRHNSDKLRNAAKIFFRKHNLFLAAGNKEDFVKNLGFQNLNEYISFLNKN